MLQEGLKGTCRTCKEPITTMKWTAGEKPDISTGVSWRHVDTSMASCQRFAEPESDPRDGN